MSEYTPNLNLFKYNPSTDGKEIFSINQALNYNWDILDNLGSGRNIGEIVASTIPLTDAGLHLLDGSLIQGDGIYSDFVDYMANLYTDNPDANYFTDETTWQDSISQYGVCGKFVYDSLANTVRLPKYSNQIYTQGLDATAPVVGNGISLGLTNGTSNGALACYTGSQFNAAIAKTDLYGYPVSTTDPSSGILTGSIGVTTDGSKSGIIAQLSDITTSLDGYYYIVIANSTKTDIQVDIDKIATDLNNKADLRDMTEVQCIVETYQNGTSWYRVYSDGWCEQGGQTAEGTSIVVSLLKAYINTNYNVQITCVNKSQSDQNWTCSAKTTNSFTYSNSESYAVDWQTCGYIEV